MGKITLSARNEQRYFLKSFSSFNDTYMQNNKNIIINMQSLQKTVCTKLWVRQVVKLQFVHFCKYLFANEYLQNFSHRD